MVVALLLALANPNLDAVDDANLALTTCGFAAHRGAAAAGKSLAQFKSELGTTCANELSTMRRAIIRLETGRGKGASGANARAEQTITDFHIFFANNYARRHENEAKLKALADAIEQQGTTDVQ